MILWDGERFYNEPDNDKARELIKKGEAQDASREDGLSLKYRHQFPQYKTRELRAEPVAEAKADDDAPSDIDWEAHKEEYKAATGQSRATKAKVIEWMESEGLA